VIIYQDLFMFPSKQVDDVRSAPSVVYPTFCFTSLSIDWRASKLKNIYIFLKARVHCRRKTRIELCVTNGIRTHDDYSDTKGLDRTIHRLHGHCYWQTYVRNTCHSKRTIGCVCRYLFRFQRGWRMSKLSYKSGCGGEYVCVCDSQGTWDTLPFVKWVQ
jgi:hypothetical protein